MKITGAQIRAGRSFLNWTIAKLAAEANVGISTVRAMESAGYDEPSIADGGIEPARDYRMAAREESVAKVAEALRKAGITFLEADKRGPGLRGRPA